MQPGTIALIAEISEEGPSILDTALNPGSYDLRSDVDYGYRLTGDDQIEDDLMMNSSKEERSVPAVFRRQDEISCYRDEKKSQTTKVKRKRNWRNEE